MFLCKAGLTVKKWRCDNAFSPFVIMRYQESAQEAQEFAANSYYQILA
jgi:hypothetical protein